MSGCDYGAGNIEKKGEEWGWVFPHPLPLLYPYPL